MSRSRIAFLVAPLWVPLVMIPVASLYLFSRPNQGPWVVISTVLGMVFGYGGTLAFGLPAFAILRSRQRTAFWIAPVLGFVIGAVTWQIFLAFFALMMSDGHLSLVVHGIRQSFNDPVQLLFAAAPGSLGALVGATLWLIARPDRPAEAP
jgi:hypothetical protein